MTLPVNSIINQDCRLALAGMPETFNCCISSPPYWSLRDYGLKPIDWGDWKGCLGLEPTPELYIKHLCDIYDLVWRVMRKDGTVWVNIADSYYGGNKGYGDTRPDGSCLSNKFGDIYGDPSWLRAKKAGVKISIKPKSLVGIPEMFVLEMQRRDWIRRATIIWVKGLSFCENYSGSCMPDSAKDRPNKNGFEYIYFFTKSKKYWFEMQYEEMGESNAERPRMGQGQQTIYKQKRGEAKNLQAREKPHTMHILRSEGIDQSQFNPLGRQFRNVWLINPQAFPDAHFATFPERLVEICLKAGCPEFVCKKCGKAREKIYEKKKYGDWSKTQNYDKRLEGTYIRSHHKFDKEISSPTFKGYTDCGCNAGWRSGLVLDMFRWLWHCRRSGCRNAA